MTKQEAIIEMMAGKKVTHGLLGPDEWITIVNETYIHTYDDTLLPEELFWEMYKGKPWEDGYSHYVEIVKYIAIIYSFESNVLIFQEEKTFPSDESLLKYLRSNDYGILFKYPRPGETRLLTKSSLPSLINFHLIRVL